MKLFTIQHAAAWETAKRCGFLAGDERHADQDFLTAYRWMQSQMSRRLSHYSGKPPIWAWLKRPDLRHRWASKGQLMVLLTVDVPPERVLVSDHEAWHFVLNKSYLGLDEEDFDSHRDSSEEALKLSWERIFGPFPVWKDFPNTHLQACVDQVYLHEVLSVRFFNGR